MRLKLLAWGERGKSERDIDVPKLRTLPILSYPSYPIDPILSPYYLPPRPRGGGGKGEGVKGMPTKGVLHFPSKCVPVKSMYIR
jgi:hypothetical protein